MGHPVIFLASVFSFRSSRSPNRLRFALSRTYMSARFYFPICITVGESQPCRMLRMKEVPQLRGVYLDHIISSHSTLKCAHETRRHLKQSCRETARRRAIAIKRHYYASPCVTSHNNRLVARSRVSFIMSLLL